MSTNNKTNTSSSTLPNTATQQTSQQQPQQRKPSGGSTNLSSSNSSNRTSGTASSTTTSNLSTTKKKETSLGNIPQSLNDMRLNEESNGNSTMSNQTTATRDNNPTAVSMSLNNGSMPTNTNLSSMSASIASSNPLTNTVSANLNARDKDKDKDATFATVTTLPGSKEKGVLGQDKILIKANGVSYLSDRVVGNGSFGVVFQATVVGNGEVVAIKKVLQDKRYKNRELQIMRLLNHPNVVLLKNSFFMSGDKPDEIFLNLVLEYVPDTVYRVLRHYAKLKQQVPLIYTKLYMYQLFRSLAYIHSMGICHRDIKPQNLLLDQNTGVLKLCDFGSAKILVRGEPNVSYICSRYYRAPELLFGSTTYTTAIDIWSTGCVLAEMLLGSPLFPGDSGVDQLVEIVKVLGTPTREQIHAMNQNYTAFKFPQIKPHTLQKVFRARTPPEAVDLISKLLQYTPSARLKPLEACVHQFFDELRDPNSRLPNNRALPQLFNFTPAEIADCRHLIPRLIPPHAAADLQNLQQMLAATPTPATTTSTSPPPTTTSATTASTSSTSLPAAPNKPVV